MIEQEKSNYAKLMANNAAQSREIKRIQHEMAQMFTDNQAFDKYCSELEAENARLKQMLARYEMFQVATKIWGY